jgi:hypothetical protein
MIFNDTGFGSPFIICYYDDLKGNLLEISDVIEDFAYKYKDQDGDTCDITIKASDPMAPDLEQFQEGAKWKVKWGYIGGQHSPTRTVIIKELIPTYDANGLTLVIKFADRASYIKQNKANKTYEGKSSLDVAEDAAKKAGVGLVVDDGTNTVRLVEPITGRGPRVQGADLFSTSNLPGAIGLQGAASAYNTYTQMTGNTDNFNKPLTLVPGDGNGYAAVDKALKNDPSGPWQMDLRDEDLIIRKRNFNKKPIGTYYYRHDEGTLISFTPETRNDTDTDSAFAAGTGVWDSLDKSFSEVITDQFSDDQETILGDEVPASDLTTEGKAAKLAVKAIAVPFKAYDEFWALLGGNWNIVKKNVDPDAVRFSTEKVGNINFQKSSPLFQPATENTAVRFWTGNFSAPVTMVTPESVGGAEEAIAELADMRRNASIEKNPGKAIVVGNPILASSEVLTFLGVSLKLSGNYYIAMVIHRISIDQGYICDMDILRNAASAIPNAADYMVDVKLFGKQKNKQVGDGANITQDKLVMLK